jgi:hypothetical protein
VGGLRQIDLEMSLMLWAGQRNDTGLTGIVLIGSIIMLNVSLSKLALEITSADLGCGKSDLPLPPS